MFLSRSLKSIRPASCAALSAASLSASLPAEEPATWKRPPEPMASLIVATPAPTVSLSPARRWLLLVQSEGAPGLEVLARPHRKLAGLRIDPQAQAPQLGARVLKIALRPSTQGPDWELPLEPGYWLAPQWSADDAWIALPRATDHGVELWLADVEHRTVKRMPGVRLNAVLGHPVSWLHDQRTLLCKLAIEGAEPSAPAAPSGPIVQETVSTKAQVRTYQDLLQDEHDAALFDFHSTVQLATVALDGSVKPLGQPARIAAVQPSPDDQLLLVSTVEKPFSYLVPWESFARRVDLLDRDGKLIRHVAQQPLQETVPIGGVPTGPREIRWLPNSPSMLMWFEALDGGDPKANVPHRDLIRRMALDGETRDWLRTEQRCQSISFGEDGSLAILTEYDRDKRREKLWQLDAAHPETAPKLLVDRSTQDAYGDPGQPVFRIDGHGHRLIQQQGSTIYLAGRGASKDGEHPFLDRWNLSDQTKERLFQSASDRLEEFAGFLGGDAQRILIGTQSPTNPLEHVAVNLTTRERQALTNFGDPAAEFAGKIQKVWLRYQRADGVPLSGQLCLPPGWVPGKKLPVVIWAYPVEYSRADDAGQMRGSPNRYVQLRGASHLWLLMAGYAVLDQASMPIVGPVRGANDTFVQQLVWNAEAAVNALVEHGVGERGNMSIMGHSYGAFMTANLLCHTDLFATGIARSGAYNRTLTPFGFQNEERTYWEAPEIYQAMSPFANANKLRKPILLIHGAADENSGTFPLQSQRLYAAIKGLGGTARLVVLPHEGHGYRSRECILQCVEESREWLERWLKKD